MTEKFFRHQMLLSPMRRYITDKVKTPLMKAIIALANKYPEPTRENCIQPNVHRLFDIWDKFLEYEHNTGREALFAAAFKLLIAEYEHDPYYRFRFDWMLEEIEKSNWKPRSRIPMDRWSEPGAIGVSPEPWSSVCAIEEPDASMYVEKLSAIAKEEAKEKEGKK